VIPSSQTQASPQRILATLQAYRDAAVLNTAIELELFTRIAHGNDTANKLAAELSVPVRGIKLLCDYLASAGLIIKDGEGLKLPADTAMFLDKRSPSYLGGVAGSLYSTRLLRGFERLTEFVRGDAGTVEPITIKPDWFDAGRGVMDLAGAARAFADAVILPGGPVKVLDVGAGNGAYGIAIAEKYPEAIIVAVDRPAPLRSAQMNGARAKLGTRYQNIPGDFLTMPLGTAYDAAILTDRLYQLEPAQSELLLSQIRFALKNSGQLLILEFLSEGRPEYAGFSLTMLTAAPHGRAYSMAEVRDLLRLADFRSVESQSLPAAHATLLTARP
jgi:ubiquinone/menaquinone biosynthesis C-methylase UbiE